MQINLKQLKLIIVSIIIALIFSSSLVAGDWTLPDEYETPAGNFKFYYTTDATSQPLNAVTSLQVTEFSVILESSRTKTLEYGYNAPPDQIPVYIFDQGINAHGNCRYSDYDPYFLGVPDAGRGTALEIEKQLVVLHEYMHSVQYCYAHSLATGGGAWITEGQARMIQDKYYSILDSADGSEFASYYGEVTGYLMDPSRPLFDLSYGAALFWQYLAERFGSITTEPDLGVDVIVEFWETLEALGDSRPTIERVFSRMFTELGYVGMTLAEVYIDFIVANYAKDISFAPEKYHYVDETQTPGSYPQVTFDEQFTIGREQHLGGLDSLGVYYPKYYRITPSSDVEFLNIEVESVSGVTLFYDLIKVYNNTFEERTVFSDRLNMTIPDAGSYDDIVLIVSGLNYPGTDVPKINYFINTGGDKASLQIITPSTEDFVNLGYKAYLSKPKFNAFIRVYNGTDPVPGLTKDDFTARIGSSIARIANAVYIRGLYILDIIPPNIWISGRFDFSVSLNSYLMDTEIDAILVEDRDRVKNDNTMLVIDTSASMLDFEKIQAAKEAARIFIHTYTPSNYYLGLAEFSTDALVVEPLAQVGTNRGNLITGVNNLIADGSSTSIGDGLFAALNEINRSIGTLPAGGTQYKKIILLTDGKENEDKLINDVRNIIINNRTHVYVIVLGLDAEGEKLQKLTEDTIRGETYYAFEPASGTLATDLADIYRTIAKKDTREYTIYKKKDVFNTTGSWQLINPFMVNAQENVSVVFSYRSETQPSNVQLALPNGTIIVPDIVSEYVEGIGYYGHLIWDIPGNINGLYNLTMNPSSKYMEYYLEASTNGPYTANVYFDLPAQQRAVGIPIPIIVSLSDEMDSIKGATVNATITSGVDYRTFFKWNVPLYDDGHHQDGFANDGIYGALFTSTIYEGGYIVDIVANGFDNSDKEFIIYNSQGFITKTGGDSDQDSLPDSWERFYGLSTSSSSGDDGPTGDKDKDLLWNYNEFRFGTNPTRPDSDFGGELDLTELAYGRNPNDPSDDAIYPAQLIGEAGDSQAIIYFQFEGNFSQFGIYRSNSLDGPFSLLNDSITPEMTNFTDLGLTNGLTYYYRMLGITTSGIYTSYSNAIGITPKTDVIAPEGFVILNSNLKSTNETRVSVEIVLDPASDVTSIVVSNNSRFDGISVYVPNTPIFVDLPPEPGLHYIFVRFVDAAGNIGGFHNGQYAYAGIHYLPDTVSSTTTSALSSTSTAASSESTTSSTMNSSPFWFDLPLLLIPLTLALYQRKRKKNQK